MKTNLWNVLKVAPVVLGASFLAANGAQAQTIAQNETDVIDQVNSYSEEGGVGSEDQLTSVFQLTDIPTSPGQPGFWAFDAIQSLVERYGCIAGYPEPDGTFTFRGERNLTRYEFAAALNACLQKIELLIANSGGTVSREDLESIYRLQQEFAAELAALGARVDNLEVRTDELEANQFSTTTKLAGEAIFALYDTFGSPAARDGVGNPNGPNDVTERGLDDQTELAAGYRVRLNFDTSFTGKDKLRTRLQARNITPFDDELTGTDATRLGFDDTTGGEVEVSELYYRFPVGDYATVQVFAVDTELWDGTFDTLSPFESSGSGSISRFGRFNPVLRSENTGAGFTADIPLGETIAFQLGWAADENSNDPSDGSGLFNGGYTGAAQVVVEPGDTFKFLVGYNRSYNPGGDPDDRSDLAIFNDPGTFFANAPFGTEVATSENSAYVSGNAQFGDFILYGTFAYSWLKAQTSLDGGSGSNAIFVDDGDSANALTAALGAQYKGLGGAKNVVGFIAGIQPYLTSNDATTILRDGDVVDREDDDLPIHLELYYRIQVNKFIRVTPGFFVVINPEGNSTNDSIFVGTIRTTFKF